MAQDTAKAANHQTAPDQRATPERDADAEALYQMFAYYNRDDQRKVVVTELNAIRAA